MQSILGQVPSLTLTPLPYKLVPILPQARPLKSKFSPDWRKDTVFPLHKMSSSSCTVKFVVAKTLFDIILPHLPQPVVIWRILQTRFRDSYDLFSHLLCLLAVYFRTLKNKCGIHLNFICLRTVRLPTDIVSDIYMNIDYLMQSIL